MVIDAHQHVWDLTRSRYAWLTPEHGPLYRSFAIDELLPQLARAGVDRTVLVQAEDSHADTELMREVAAAHPDVVAGIVGWVPLLDPAATEMALDRLADDPRIVGVRHLIHDEPDPDWLLRPAVGDSLRLVAERGLTFDVVAVLSRHLEHVPVIAERVPELTLIVDHLAKPPIRERGWQPWADLLAAAARCPNVVAKVSGLNTAADPERWTAADLRPYVEHAVACFGADRLMFGGDWPVAILAGDYEQVARETRAVLAPLGEAERAAVLGGTAIRAYGLPIEAAA